VTKWEKGHGLPLVTVDTSAMPGQELEALGAIGGRHGVGVAISSRDTSWGLVGSGKDSQKVVAVWWVLGPKDPSRIPRLIGIMGNR
jgi:hypothetical protein